MNTRIARRLNECRNEQDPERAIRLAASDITDACNAAVRFGLVDLPMFEFVDVYADTTQVCVGLCPVCGVVNVDELYKLKSAWGADEANVYMTDDLNEVDLVFKAR